MKCTNASNVPTAEPSADAPPDRELGLEQRQFAEIVGREIARFWKDTQRSAPIKNGDEMSCQIEFGKP